MDENRVDTSHEDRVVSVARSPIVKVSMVRSIMAKSLDSVVGYGV